MSIKFEMENMYFALALNEISVFIPVEKYTSKIDEVFNGNSLYEKQLLMHSIIWV